MVNISGFGRESERANWPVYDEIAQAVSGLMELTGPKDGPPTLVGTFMVDHLAGLYATIGTLAALQQRTLTGRGEEVDVTLLGSGMSTLMTHIPWHLLTGETVTRNGSRHRLHAAINAYPTRDGYIYVASARDHMFARLMRVVGREDLLTDPDFSTDAARAKRLDEVDAVITAWTRLHTSDEATRTLAQAGVASGPIRTVAEVAADPEVRSQGLLIDVMRPDGKQVPVMGNPIRLGRSRPEVRHSPPAVGQHNEYVFCRLLGHSPSELAAWKSEGVI
jgi:crotonobetainyl-CoA:carnitine CoA-transferase CaiB-like acyl-CoA transferase